MSFLHRHRWLTPYLLLAPGAAFLVLFFVVLLYYLAYTSLQEGPSRSATRSAGPGTTTRTPSTRIGSSSSVLSSTRESQRSPRLISYPLTYWIAFRGGRRRTQLLPSSSRRSSSRTYSTLAWQSILSDDGFVLHAFQAIGLVADDGRLLATRPPRSRGSPTTSCPHGAAALREPRADRQQPHRGGEGSLRLEHEGVLRVTLPLSMPGVIGNARRRSPPQATSSTRSSWARRVRDDRHRHPVEVPRG